MIIGHSLTDKKIIRNIIKKKDSVIYFIGIGGISMSALAEMSLAGSKRVYGSDIRRSAVTAHLESRGIRIRYTQARANVMEVLPDLVVYSLSISPDNPEYAAAKAMGILTVSRAEYLGVLMESYAMRIGVSGSHGKSTVTAMLGSVLSYASRSPSILCGAEISKGTGYIPGGGEYLVYEACEYGDSFLRFSPKVQIMLNLDFDHPDYFPDVEALMSSFVLLANMTEELVIINADDANLRSLLPHITAHVVTFSRDNPSDYRYSVVCSERGRYTFDLFFGDALCGRFTLGIAGEFNVQNAVAAIIAARHVGISDALIGKAVKEFSGIGRRLELLGSHSGFDLYYDYAHHPCEIKATERALRDMGYLRIAAVFSPHTYSRTKALFDGFVSALSGFDSVFITDIYGAREAPVVGVSSYSLAEAVRQCGKDSHAIAASEDIIPYITSGKYDCLVLMGAGDLDLIKKKTEDL